MLPPATEPDPSPTPGDPPVPRIDAHHHVWDLDTRDQPWTHGLAALNRTFTVDDLRPALNRNAIDATVVVQTSPTEQETAELLALAAEDPHVKAVVGWTDLTDAAVVERLASLREGSAGSALVGIRHAIQSETDPGWLSRPDVRRGLRAVAAAGLVYELLVRPDQLPDAVHAVRTLPEVRFVLDHAGNPVIDADGLSAWTALMSELAASPNVAVKLSGLVTRTTPPALHTLRPCTEVLLSVLGPHRLMYGSDWPVCLLAAPYDEVITLTEALVQDLSAHEHDAVFGATASRWYGICG
ncbi:amidohydrolase family protein [Streptomyces sp. NPDC091972]|uniref:amidohydrolase family protein n=1 Tax=Streptomyces sp. NPDC091972 TaxID=3366007 RepID=UPI00381284CA